MSRLPAAAIKNMASPLASSSTKYSPSFGWPRTSRDPKDIQTTARSARPSRSLKNTAKPSSTSIRPKSHVPPACPRRPRMPSPGSPVVQRSAAAAPSSATVPGHSPAVRPRAVATKSTTSTASSAAIRSSSGRKYGRLSALPISARGHLRGRSGGAHLVGEPHERRALEVEHERRVDAEHEHDHGERRQREQLAAVDLGQARVLGVRLPEVHALERPEQVAGREDDRARRDDGERGVDPPRPEQHQHLGDERREPRQPHGGEE